MVISFFHLVDVIARLVVVKRGFTCFFIFQGYFGNKWYKSKRITDQTNDKRKYFITHKTFCALRDCTENTGEQKMIKDIHEIQVSQNTLQASQEDIREDVKRLQAKVHDMQEIICEDVKRLQAEVHEILDLLRVSHGHSQD